MIRTRFAPSPTGFIHVGNLRTAIYTYLIAKNKEGKFILRIEDTDRERLVEGATDVIYETLNICNLNADESPKLGGDFGPYVQSERFKLYKQYALELLDKGEAYRCFCTEERLKDLKKNDPHATYDKKCRYLSEEEIEKKLNDNVPFVIRQKIPGDGSTSFKCHVYGEISINNCEIEDQVILKSDEYPTYNFANVVDDHLMNITHVVRGNEYLTSTPKYTLLYKAFGWEEPEYIHLPLVVKPDGKKLSKRDGDAYFSDFVNRGFLPEAIVNYLALLGWSHPDNKEILSLEELVESFDYKRINNSPSIFDEEKLKWVNSQYIKELSNEHVADLANVTFEENGLKLDKEMLLSIVALFKDRLTYISELYTFYMEFINSKSNLTEEAVTLLKEEGVSLTLKTFVKELDKIEYTPEAIKKCIKDTGKASNAKGKLLFMPIRVAITAELHGPDLPSLIHILGKEEVITRINNTIKNNNL